MSDELSLGRALDAIHDNFKEKLGEDTLTLNVGTMLVMINLVDSEGNNVPHMHIAPNVEEVAKMLVGMRGHVEWLEIERHLGTARGLQLPAVNVMGLTTHQMLEGINTLLNLENFIRTRNDYVGQVHLPSETASAVALIQRGLTRLQLAKHYATTNYKPTANDDE